MSSLIDDWIKFQITHIWLFKRVREAALVPAPHLGCQFWVLHVSTERYLTGTVADIDWGPVAGGQQQVYVVPSCLSSHQVLRAAHHLDTGRGQKWIGCPDKQRDN